LAYPARVLCLQHHFSRAAMPLQHRFPRPLSPAMPLLTAFCCKTEGSCCRWLLLGVRSQRAAVSGHCMCVGTCCCIHDDSEVRVSELKQEGFGSNLSELSTSAGSSDEGATDDGFNSFFSSVSCGNDGSALSDDAEVTIDAPNPVPRSSSQTATDVDSERHNIVRCLGQKTSTMLLRASCRRLPTFEHRRGEIESPDHAAGPKKFGVAVSSNQRLAEVDLSEGCLGPGLGPMSRRESCQLLATSFHKEHETDSSDDSDGMVSSNLSFQDLTTDGLGEVASGDDLRLPWL